MISQWLFCLFVFLCFLFLALRRPVRSTLFPYTTLFRSGLTFTFRDRPDSGDPLLANLSVKREGRSVDRKSTRLNSSHEWISYAVFCLKKKTDRTSSGFKATIIENSHGHVPPPGSGIVVL